MRSVAVVAAAGTLVAGLAVYGSAQAQEAPTPGAAQVSAQTGAATLRGVAAPSGRFVGTAVNDGLLGDPTYTDIASTEFSSVTAEHAMTWGVTEPSRGVFDFTAADRLVDFANENLQQVYGHTLVWHNQLPGWVSKGGFDAEELNQVMVDHITGVAGHFAGRIARWDVVNEALDDDGTLRDSVFQTTIGPEYIANAFRAARAVDPFADLCINDYDVEGVNAKSDALHELVSSLLQEGVPIDCVGLEAHLVLGQVPDDLRENMQRFADLGLDVIITELDIRMAVPADDARLDQQAEDYAAVVSACVAVAGCQGVTVWGISDRDSWVPGTFPGEGAACVWDESYQPKPAYDGMLTAFGG